MSKNDLSDKKKVLDQYKNDAGLNARKNLHQKYSTNKLGYGKWLFSQYDLYSGCRVLELGSGNGDLFFVHIDKLSESIDLILSDFSDGMVDILKQRYANKKVTIQTIDIQNIPYEDESFDIVIANAMLYHVPNLDLALKEVSRILKKGGRFYAATFGDNGMSEYFERVFSDLGYIFPDSRNYSFTLQNGTEILKKHFKDVKRIDYIDRLEITETKPLVDYVNSMSFWVNKGEVDKEKLENYFDNILQTKGVIEIPKEYGTFVASKK